MFDNSYTQTLQDQIGQLSKLLGGQAAGTVPEVQTPANRFDYVAGIEGARAFLQKMLANTKHIVWDSEKAVFYILQKDANGNPARIQICPFTVELEPTMEEKYVSREDFNALVSRLDALIAKEADNG
ncbi:MAG: hypothetical protein IJT62_07460 [Oscillospiraceae bacterium]|nr:hypothetical protein [Oscillospiraceae bacterium]